MNDLDLTGVGSFGLGGLLLLLAYRLLMKQTQGWEGLNAAERALSTALRAELDEVRAEAHAARLANEACEEEHAKTREQLDRLIDRLIELGIPLGDGSAHG